mgnify:CR=1 FL=1
MDQKPSNGLREEAKDPSLQDPASNFNLIAKLMAMSMSGDTLFPNKNSINLLSNEKELKLFQALQSIQKEQYVKKELESINFDIDFGSFEVQRKFYLKYIVIKQPEISNEAEKSKKLKVQIILKDQKPIHLTRIRLDELLSKFRKIYATFCEVKCFLKETSTRLFDEIFDFDGFLRVEEELPERLIVESSHTRFNVRWQRELFDEGDNLYMNDDMSDPVLTEEFYRTNLLALVKVGTIGVIRSVTGVFDVSDEKLVGIFIKDHIELFEFFLKNVKINHANKVLPRDDFSSNFRDHLTEQLKSEEVEIFELSSDHNNLLPVFRTQGQTSPPKKEDSNRQSPILQNKPEPEPVPDRVEDQAKQKTKKS